MDTEKLLQSLNARKARYVVIGATAFASQDDLIRMKQAARRPKDLEDLKVLRKLQEHR